MRNFDIFYFDNDVGKFDEFNPRFVMEQTHTSEIIAILAHHNPFKFSANDLKIKLKINDEAVQKSIKLLKNISAIKIKDEKFALAFPFFINNDCKKIKKIVLKKLEEIEETFEKKIDIFRKKVSELYPNIDESLSLYHLLCGKIFDGFMFDFLEKQNLLKQTFPKKDNRDYMIIGYEAHSYCKKFNAELFCSFNHAHLMKSSLSSFGNAEGNRFDYFRYFKLREKYGLFGKFLIIDEDLKIYSSEEIVEKSLDVLNYLYHNKPFEKDVFYNNLKRFRYINERDEIIVPVFYNYIEKCAKFNEFVINELKNILVENLLEIKDEILLQNITCVKHGVSTDQLCNELWHIYFGLLNKFLIDKKYVATPQHFKGEGRYLKCVYFN